MTRYAYTAAIALAATLAACGAEEPQMETQPATPVRAIEAIRTDQTEHFRSSGTVASRAEMNLTFKTPGYVRDVLVDEGDRVARGQVLARLQMTEVDAQLRAATSQADFASKNLDRMQRLFADSVIAEARLDEATDAHERAQAGLELARFNHDHATIRAPSSGRILSRGVEVAEFTSPGAPAFRFGSTSSGWVVRVGVPDHQVFRIALGNAATVSLPAVESAAVQGRVSEISDAADPRSGTFEVEVTLLSDAPLRSGMVAEVVIELTDADALVYLPPQSLVDADGMEGSVFVIEDGVARRRDVRVVTIGVDQIGVDGDDLDGARVVTAGAAYLRDGDRVALVASF